ncbi:hypothetical protein [Rhodanobacter hydrolyticus]|uniref:Uncharacterized protein n=1 Tax=Rhodanobacter hydrolyticus TaxID=2250595 RepID=A0ABW8J3T2_9GAMM
MTQLNVQFSDSTESTIIAYFANAQDPTQYPNQSVIQASDIRWKTYFDEQSTWIQGLLVSPGNN